jgi:hypothetical protein
VWRHRRIVWKALLRLSFCRRATQVASSSRRTQRDNPARRARLTSLAGAPMTAGWMLARSPIKPMGSKGIEWRRASSSRAIVSTTRLLRRADSDAGGRSRCSGGRFLRREWAARESPSRDVCIGEPTNFALKRVRISRRALCRVWADREQRHLLLPLCVERRRRRRR